VQLKHTLGADLDLLSRFYLSYSGSAPTAAELNSFCTSLAAAWVSDFKPMCTASCILVEIIAEDLSSSSGASGTWSGSDAGDRGGTTPTASVSALMNFTIARRYRGGKPRVYLPFGNTGDIASPQSWGGSFVTAMNTAWASFITAAVAAVWTGGGTLAQVNVSYYEGFEPFKGPSGRYRNIPTLRGTPVVDVVSSVVCNSKIASQRRRLGKR
jgi:hypothetical protein